MNKDKYNEEQEQQELQEFLNRLNRLLGGGVTAIPIKEIKNYNEE
ncbi:hypothetical protein [Gallibacterium salpingitidis]|nr:hypothetical protein [Gallibacterium salpingitidis]